MKPQTTSTNGHKRLSSATGRDIAAILFRHRGLALVAFLGIFALGLVFALVLADRYEAHTMILVQQSERADPVITGQANAQPVIDHNGVTPDQMTSELELLRSEDLLEQVVVASGLNKEPLSLLGRLRGYQGMTHEQRIEKEASDLAEKLDAQIVKDTNLISVSYRASDPRMAARVLQVLDELYLKKHVAVHRPPGTLDFFRQQTDQYQRGLVQAEGELLSFVHNQGVVSPQLQRDVTLQRLSDFEALEGQTQASIAEAEHRIHALDAKAATLPARQTTAVTTSDNAQLLQQLNSTLLDLELRRTDLLEKYAPTYRLVQDVEKQISQTRAAIQAAEAAKWRQETTDRDPNFELVREELTKAQADLAGYKARAAALGQAANAFQTKALWLEKQDVHQQDLLRNIKTAEDNYQLYLTKQEEARISEALDARRILNVIVAEAATVPALPVHSDLFYIVLAAFFAGLGCLGCAFLADNLDPTLRTPDEVEAVLNIPVLVSFPKGGNHHANGNGNGNGHYDINRIGAHVS